MGVFDFVFSLIFIIMDHPVISFCVFFVSVVAFVIFVILKKRSAKKYVIPGRVVPFDSVPATNDTSAKVMDPYCT